MQQNNCLQDISIEQEVHVQTTTEESSYSNKILIEKQKSKYEEQTGEINSFDINDDIDKKEDTLLESLYPQKIIEDTNAFQNFAFLQLSASMNNQIINPVKDKENISDHQIQSLELSNETLELSNKIIAEDMGLNSPPMNIEGEMISSPKMYFTDYQYIDSSKNDLADYTDKNEVALLKSLYLQKYIEEVEIINSLKAKETITNHQIQLWELSDKIIVEDMGLNSHLMNIEREMISSPKSYIIVNQYIDSFKKDLVDYGFLSPKLPSLSACELIFEPS